jgi:hypothetical protein
MTVSCFSGHYVLFIEEEEGDMINAVIDVCIVMSPLDDPPPPQRPANKKCFGRQNVSAENKCMQ